MIHVNHNNSASKNYLNSPIFAILHDPQRWGRATWQQRGKDLNIAEPASHPPAEPREHSLRDASVHIRAPLSSISQENENNKKLYSALATRENLCADASRAAQKSYNYPPHKTQLLVNGGDIRLISTLGILRCFVFRSGAKSPCKTKRNETKSLQKTKCFLRRKHITLLASLPRP